MHDVCLRCGSPIIGRRPEALYCSDRCAKLYLKSQYRKRNREKIRESNRLYRMARHGGDKPPSQPSKLREDQCLNCGSKNDLQLAHVKPLWAGGVHKHVVTLCRMCHNKFDNLLRGFWQQGLEKRQSGNQINK